MGSREPRRRAASDGGATEDDRASVVARRALACFLSAEDAIVGPLGRGLINQTFRASLGDRTYVLQRVNPIFDPRIHYNIEAVTRRLEARGVETPRLVPTHDGRLWSDLGTDGIWRLMTLVGGASFDRVGSPAQAFAAGELVGRFHSALEGLDHEFVGLRLGVHDTARHLDVLRAAMASRSDHRLAAEVTRMGGAILHAAASMPPLAADPLERIGHGDLKLNNLLFASADATGRARAVALVDLDTVGPVQLAHELGDAWRSWCNRAGEDSREASFDLEIFEHAWGGYQQSAGELDASTRIGLLLGPEWISLELAARFAADALNETYFGWDPSQHAGRGEHNLARAHSQWAVHLAAVGCRRERARMLEVPAP